MLKIRVTWGEVLILCLIIGQRRKLRLDKPAAPRGPHRPVWADAEWLETECQGR
jgi:hypothetical protein